MTVEEKCAERYTEGTGGYLVCVDETYRHDTTLVICGMVFGLVALLAFMYFFYRIIRGK